MRRWKTQDEACVVIVLADGTRSRFFHPAWDVEFLQGEFDHYVGMMNTGELANWNRLKRDEDGKELGIAREPTPIMGVRWYNRDTGEEYAKKVFTPGSDVALVEASLKNARRGEVEPLWTIDLSDLRDRWQGIPEAIEIIQKVSALRMSMLGSEEPVTGEK